jgi:hypothetical protein
MTRILYFIFFGTFSIPKKQEKCQIEEEEEEEEEEVA